MRLHIAIFLLLAAASSQATESVTAYIVYPSTYITKGKVFEVNNMPKIKDQRPYDTCTAYAAQQLVQNYICKVKNIVPCDSVKPEDEASPIALSGFARPSNPNGYAGLITSHKNVWLLPDFSIHPYNIIYNAAYSFYLVPESCLPSEGFTGLSSGSRDLAEDKVAWLESFYQRTDKTTPCGDCELAFTRMLRRNITEKQIMTGLQKKTFAEFLFAILFPSDTCKARIEVTNKPRAKYFPPRLSNVSKQDLIEKMESILKSDIPFQVANVCNDGFIDGKCHGVHTIVVAGMKTVCHKDNPSLCRKLYKVHNSLGKEWQDEANDGWIDAEIFVDNIARPYQVGIISWYENESIGMTLAVRK